MNILKNKINYPMFSTSDVISQNSEPNSHMKKVVITTVLHMLVSSYSFG